MRHGHGDATSPAIDVRSRVYEYGGTPYAVREGRIVHVGEVGERFADLFIAADGDVLALRERGDVHDLVALPDRVIADGHDFFAAPRRSDDGRTAWMTWDHPDMPWDASQVWLDGELVAGGPGVSAGQPRFSPGGDLHYCSDHTGYWNIYRADGEPVVALDADFSGPDWDVGQSTYSWLADGTFVATWVKDGLDHLGYVRAGALHEIDTPFRYFESVHGQGDTIICIAGSAAEPTAVVRISLDGAVERLRVSRELPFDAAYVSHPRAVGHSLFYPPQNPDFTAPQDELPPVIVLAHGGPTGRFLPTLDVGVQFWTTRGFAVLQVNYRGSTGYGRAYRDALRGQWGVYDVEDCVAAVDALSDEVDRDRAVIRGGSAGGYTVLRALTTTDAFAAGISRFGVGDLRSLAQDTHKLESRYLESLVGVELYDERSPLTHADRLNTPTLLLQGLEDKVVPPSQSELMRDAMARRGIPHAYVAFEGEGHGFRRADTIRKAARAELIFLGGVLGLKPDNLPDPVSELNLILIGPPGAGKGTQAENLQADFGLPYIATGDLMRAKRQEDSDLGREIARIIAAGDLVPDEVVCKALFEKVDEEGDDGFLLDGFPRTVGQADTLDDALSNRGRQLTAVLHIDVPEDTIVQRLAGRRVCSKNNAHVYHVDFNKPKHEGVCDIDGAKLTQRDDDKPETIKNRLATYDRETKPLLARYEEAGLLRTFDGTRSPDEVHRHIRATLATLKLEERL